MEDYYLHEGKVMRRLWDNNKELGHVMRADSTKISLHLVTRDGIKYVNLRDFYQKRTDGEWRASSTGIVIPYIVPVKRGKERIEPFKEVMQLLRQAEELLVDFPLADKDNAVYVLMKPNKMLK